MVSVCFCPLWNTGESSTFHLDFCRCGNFVFGLGSLHTSWDMNEGRQQDGFGGFSSGIWEIDKYGKQIIENDTHPCIQSHQFISHS